MGSQKSKSNLIPIQQLERNGRFNTFHKYIYNVLSIRLANETDCEHFRNKYAVVYMKFIHNFVVDMFVWIWEFRTHLSCLEPVFYAYISSEVSDSYYSILKESPSNVSLEAFWINSVPSRLQHNKCLSIYWKSFPNASAKIYNCTRNMILTEVFPNGMFNRSWKSVSKLCVSIGGNLPVFRSMFDLEEFLTVPRHFDGEQLIAIFIGLYMVPGKSESKMSFFPTKVPIGKIQTFQF